MRLNQIKHAKTHALGGVNSPLKLVAHYDTAHIYRTGEPVLAITGIGARMIGELVACAAPVAWRSVAVQIWSEAENDDAQLRRKWDISLARLRRKLKDVGIRPTLIHSDGTGNVELLPAKEDEIIDKT
jgi:sugar phosphate isomerase/epimerase